MKSVYLFVFAIVLATPGLGVLVDSEDFQSYSTSTNIVNQSAEWSCYSGYTAPTCYKQQGSPTPAIGGHYVALEGSNKFLRIYAQGWDDLSNRMFAALVWNHQNGSTIGTYGDAWYTISVRMRLGSYSDDYVNGTNNDYTHAGIGEGVLTALDVIDKIYIGGDKNCGEGNCQLAVGHYTRGAPTWTWYSALYDKYPSSANTNCTLEDYAWHNIDYQMHYNASLTRVDRVVTYQDGIQCFAWSPSITSTRTGAQTFFQGMVIAAEGLYTYDLDNIQLYADETPITHECSDGVDNDLDGYTDYPSDPSCDSTTDDTESPVDASASCDVFSLPYYLVETFNGYLSDCGWSVNVDFFNNGDLDVPSTTGYYYAQKQTYSSASSLPDETNLRYVTTTLDINVVNITVYGSTISLRWYDYDSTNYFTAYFRDSGEYLWYSLGGLGIVAANITLGTSYPYMFVFDLQDNTADIYYNGTLAVSDTNMAITGFNVENQAYFKISSNNAEFIMDNVEIYASDASGVPLLPDETVYPVIDNQTSMCGLFFSNPANCTDDTDCVTGDCLPNGECNSFDMTYCDEHGKKRGSSCVIGAVAYCTLSSTGDIILANFFLFLVLLIIIIGLAYLVYMWKV